MAEIAARILGRADDLAARMVTAYGREIPQYRALTAAVVERDVHPVAHGFVHDFFTHLQLHLRGSPAAAGMAEAAHRRLDLGISLDSSLHAFRVAGRVVWEEVLAVTRPGEEALLGQLASSWLDYMDRASSTFANAYLTASHESLRRVDARRRELLEALVSAGDPAELAAVAARFSMNFADRYTPVLLEGDGAAVAIDRLLAAAPEGSIGGPRGARVLLLLPGAVDPTDLLRTAGPLIAAWGEPGSPGADLLRATGHLETTLTAARRAGRSTGIFGPRSLLLERLLVTAPTVAAAVVETSFAPLRERDPDGILRSTLRTYLACGSVPLTAEREVVHVNTVAYRLRRVLELTGLDPRVPDQAALLVLATRVEQVKP